MTCHRERRAMNRPTARSSARLVGGVLLFLAAASARPSGAAPFATEATPWPKPIGSPEAFDEASRGEILNAWTVVAELAPPKRGAASVASRRCRRDELQRE